MCLTEHPLVVSNRSSRSVAGVIYSTIQGGCHAVPLVETCCMSVNILEDDAETAHCESP